MECIGISVCDTYCRLITPSGVALGKVTRCRCRCLFSPTAYPDDTGASSGSSFGSVWYSPPTETTTHRVFGGNIFVKTDSSAKFRRIGRDGGGNIADYVSDPFSVYDANVRGTSYTGCRPTGSTGPYYWCFFRPDLEL